MSHFEQIADMCARHGEWVQLDDGVRVFQDGAALQIVTNFLTGKPDHIEAQEPPDDPYKLLLRRKTFLTAKIQMRANDFAGAKAQFMEQQKHHAGSMNRGGGSTCPPAQHDAEQILLDLKSQIEALNLELAEVQSLVTGSPLHQSEQAATRARDSERAEASRRVMALAGIKLDAADTAAQPDAPADWQLAVLNWQREMICRLEADAQQRKHVHNRR